MRVFCTNLNVIFNKIYGGFSLNLTHNFQIEIVVKQIDY